MKAAILEQYDGTFRILETRIDDPRGREVLVQVKASGLCHTDLHLAETDYGVPLPALFGHEISGVVKGVGPDVRDFAVGDHVVGSPIQYCGHCRSCLQGRTYICDTPGETLRGAAEPPRLSYQGSPVTPVFGTAGFAEFALIHENQLAAVPKELPFPQACLLGCSCITGAGAAINTAGVKPGETVAVIGIGGVGLNVLAGARLVGASRIVAIDMQPSKEALSRKFGATDFIDARHTDTVAAVRALIGGGADHVFEAIGLKTTSEQAIKMARRGGGAYFIGVHKPNSPIALDVFADLLNQQVTIKGVLMGSTNIKRDIPMYADLYLQGRFNLDDLISREISISEINDAYRDLKLGALARSVITSF